MISTVTKTMYINPPANKDGVFIDDALFYVIANEDGTRKLGIKKRPKYKYYKAKKNMGYHRMHVNLEDLEPIECEYRSRYSNMAAQVMLRDEYKSINRQDKRDWVQANILNNPNIYLADMDVEDTFKMNYSRKFGDNSGDIVYKTSFTDIEVRADKDDFEQHKALVPICSICHLDANTETIYVNVLDDPEVPMIREVFSDLGSFLIEFEDVLAEVRRIAIEKIVKDKGKPESIHHYKFKYKFYLLNTEADLIRNYFSIIQETRPDFVGIWNINFDMITIKERAAKLGLNMADLTSDKSVPPEYRIFKYIEDHERFNNSEGKKSATHYSRYFDKVITTSVTQYYCQMSMHSNLRKRFLEENYKLETIGEKYAYIKKFDLAAEGLHIKDVYVKNFKKFLIYAIIDPIVSFQIEYMNQDIPRYMITCKDTRFTHGFKKTIVIKNEFYNYIFDTKHAIIGNNKTYDIWEPTPGAIIASPSKIERKGINLLGVFTHIYRLLSDLDINSEYPSLMISFQILKTTIFGRIYDIRIDQKINDMNISIPISDGGEFNRMLENIDTSIFDIGTKYFGLPTMDTIIADIERRCLISSKAG